jgi:hypothetical protein
VFSGVGGGGRAIMILLVENKWIAVILRDLKKELVLLSLILTSQEL